MVLEPDAFDYCPTCASPTTKPETYLIVCKECGYRYYSTPRATASVLLLNYEGKVLLVRRLKDPQRGMWDVPGGFSEPEETLEETARREIKEELGVTLGHLDYLGSWPNWYEYQGVELPTMDVFFTGLYDQEEIVLNEEIDEHQWFTLDEIPWDRIAFPSQVSALQAL